MYEKKKILSPKGVLLWAFAFLLLFKLPVHAQEAERTITGRVFSNENQPLAAATISVKGQNKGIATDDRGQFSITAKTGDVVVVSSIGYQTREVKVGTGNLLDVVLSPTDTKMSEVVVVGYGSAKRANLTVAQTTVTAKDMNRTINTTVEQAIQGRAAGVYVTQNTGQPGGGISVNIRGVSSINGTTEPLYVVDGIQIPGSQISFGAQSSVNPLAGLNPSDIEDIQILQGPSATAIYGSRATNGVVLITTKRGKAGQTRFNYNFQYSLQTPPKKLDVMNLQQYAQMVKEFHAIAGGETPEEFLDPSLLGKGTDWQDELFRTAAMQKHEVNMSGGNQTTTYYLSGDYLKQDGVALGSGFDRYSFRVNLDNKPREWVTIGANLNFNQTNEQLTTSQENIISNALQLTPQIPVKNIDGTWGGGDITNGANQFAPVNPIAIASMTTNKSVRRQILGGLNLGIKLMKDLTFRTSLNANVNFGNSQYYVPSYKIGWAVNDRASLTEGTNTSTYWNWNQLLEYNKQLGKHSLGVMAAHESQASTWKNVYTARTGFLTNDILDLNAGDPLTASNSGGSGPWAMESYFGRLNYNYDNRYILTGTLRYDGSSNFGADKKWGWFPSISGAWRVSQEKWFDVPWISELKLRLETGLTGNQGGGAYIYSPLTTAPTPTGTGFLPGRYGNTLMGWEETRTNNIGFNLGLVKNRINIEFDYYRKKTSDLNMEYLLPWYLGSNGTGAVSPPVGNIGTLENNGWGVTINTVNINNSKFRWETNFNISHFKTKATKFNSANGFFDRISWWLNDWTQRASLGQAPWLFRGYVEEGLFTSIEEIENSAVPVDNNGNRLPIEQQNGLWVGDVKYKDVNNDGIINENDLTTIGNPWPKLFLGFTNSFSYKGFDLSILITGTYGNDIYNYMARVNSNPNNINLSRNLLLHTMDYARPTDAGGKVGLENPGTDVARISYGPNGNYARHTSKWVEDGSFLRLKNATLSYRFDQNMLGKQKVIQGLRLSVTGQNIFTLTKYKGMDPEVGSYVGRDASAGNQAIGLDYGRYPITPMYAFSIGVEF